MRAILPAAGRSRRMGRSKPLLPFSGTTVIGSIIERLQAASVTSILVVTRRDDAELAAWLDRRGIARAVNPEPERGMLSSIWAGIAALGGPSAIAADHATLLVTPADHPSIETATVGRLLTAVSLGAGLAVPVYSGRRGHPLVIANRLIAEIERLDLERGLHQLLERFPGEVVEIAVADRGVVADIDTPGDYRRILRETRE